MHFLRCLYFLTPLFTLYVFSDTRCYAVTLCPDTLYKLLLSVNLCLVTFYYSWASLFEVLIGLSSVFRKSNS